MDEPRRRPYNFYVDEDLLQGLRDVKARDGIPESEQIRRALRAWLTGKRVGVRRAAPASPRTRSRT